MKGEKQSLYFPVNMLEEMQREEDKKNVLFVIGNKPGSCHQNISVSKRR